MHVFSIENEAIECSKPSRIRCFKWTKTRCDKITDV